MTFALHYEQINSSFQTRRTEMLDVMTNAFPSLADVHRRKWRVLQLKNAISDIKETIAACNMQIDKERALLDEYHSENTRLSAQEIKLTEDVKLLEGVTGMEAILPSDGDAQLLTEIKSISDQFRDNSSDFYFELGSINQELKFDESIRKESKMMVSTLQDFIDVTFDTRANDANLSRKIDDLSIHAEELKHKVEDEHARFNRKFKNAKKAAQDEYDQKQDVLIEKLDGLKKEYQEIKKNSKDIQTDLNKQIYVYEARQKALSKRFKNKSSYNDALKENLRRRAMTLEFDLDRLENRLRMIKTYPTTADQSLINYSLVIGDKSILIREAIAHMREEISQLNSMVRNSN
ncbi:hypothetical protein TVAG_443980 [Trichomonas vaginalis G3]|uniref:Uncharacterized protein n=1 Tax=Trichomonas vaginalis (strain ATCC PRA-98 / G3) TaxID=412133 RepID=A2E2E0_TRIV3|nr:hypothetical protein TVAGG3_0305340 [Trichomonas vaginalis G3]EAY13115.1 hypothetical protein TVAG_443980 [Trichomonas vaginalis G3]KAI5528216.1 hypothetical protein TVAGG3_0305340 [Trichomonas vaginalis G3]|eukprot:XP_001325338.1 hypothetical protein [Trichomonas vaginalis G3]